MVDANKQPTLGQSHSRDGPGLFLHRLGKTRSLILVAHRKGLRAAQKGKMEWVGKEREQGSNYHMERERQR